MARNDPTIYMRIPQELKDALDAASTENKRSLTAEVVARLEASFQFTEGGTLLPGDVAERLDSLEATLRKLLLESAPDTSRLLSDAASAEVLQSKSRMR